MAISSPRIKRWTRREYERLVDLGAFLPGDRFELGGGDLLLPEPPAGPHLHTGRAVAPQGPVALDDDSEPEPDIAVVPGSRRDHFRAHPSHPVLRSRSPT